MKIAVTGSSGLVGQHACGYFASRSHDVIRIVRHNAAKTVSELLWKPKSGEIDLEMLEGLDAVVHLAGDNIASARWSPDKKKTIRDSRVSSTRLLSESLAALSQPPRTLLCASAVGYYGNQGDKLLTEDAERGSGFLSDVCRDWEEATQPAEEAGIRVAHLRIGMVISAKGGALKSMLFPFKLGLGGPVGRGDQYWSWIAVDDLVTAMDFILQNEQLSGPINLVAPNAVTSEAFGKILGACLSRPSFMPLPAFAARIIMGEMADALLLSSTRVEPRKLLDEGFSFRYPDLEEAIRHELAIEG